jgi:hypothetical protein
LSEFNWRKPVLSLYRENNEQPEREAFAVIKAQKLIVKEKDEGFDAKIEDFFCLMGDVDEIQPGKRYVVCWFDDSVEDFRAGFRRLAGVTFPSGVSFTVDKKDKRSYNAALHAKYAKLK